MYSLQSTGIALLVHHSLGFQILSIGCIGVLVNNVCSGEGIFNRNEDILKAQAIEGHMAEGERERNSASVFNYLESCDRMSDILISVYFESFQKTF